MKKSTPGKIGKLYQLIQPVAIVKEISDTSEIIHVNVNSVVMLLEKKNNSAVYPNAVDYKVLTVTGKIGWISSIQPGWFKYYLQVLN
jgi:hypothetical protein